MVLVKGSLEDAIRVLINLWLKDRSKYCLHCDKKGFYEDCETCHGKPLLGDNQEALKLFSLDMQRIRQTRANKFASTDDKTIRQGASMPTGLYMYLKKALKKMYHVDFLKNEGELLWFLKKFGKYFQVPEEM